MVLLTSKPLENVIFVAAGKAIFRLEITLQDYLRGVFEHGLLKYYSIMCLLNSGFPLMFIRHQCLALTNNGLFLVF